LLSLNADARLGPGYVDALVAALEADRTVAAASGVLVLPEGVIDSTGIALTRAFVAIERDRGSAPAHASAGEPFGVSGAASLWRREALEELGPAPWWEWLFVYWDDVELAWRLRRKGWRFAIVPAARAEHVRGSDFAPARFVEAAAVRNRLGTVARHAGWRGLLRPGPLAVTALSVARLLVRRPRTLVAAHPVRAVRAGRAARTRDDELAPLDPSVLVAHPWRDWLAQQLSGGRRGLGAVASRR
jgi:GT2 family glycosyltransferase